MKGIVIKSTGSRYIVFNEQSERIKCTLKGNYRLKGSKSTNPVTVGDNVEFIFSDSDKTGLITRIEPRKNYIIRKSKKLSKQTHIIAANIDQAIVIVTLAFPRTSTGFIDRFLITAEAYHIPAIIVFNKCDLFDDVLKSDLADLVNVYELAGYKCVVVSALKKINTDNFSQLLKNKISLVSGHSGVGKSALVNVVNPSLNLKTGSISKMHLKGTHTTTFSEMYRLSSGGFVIDTPGIKEFGLIDFKKEEVSHFFPDLFRYIHDCQFANCTHTHEVNCAVKKAVKENNISESRYNSYLSIMNGNELDVQNWQIK